MPLLYQLPYRTKEKDLQLAALRGRQAIGHVVVISGYHAPNRIVINDPLKRVSVTMTYQQFANAYEGQMRWSESLVIY